MRIMRRVIKIASISRLGNSGGQMPQRINTDAPFLIEDQIIAAFEKTSKEDREYIAQTWAMNYMFDISDFVAHTGLPPIALKVASLIDTEHPLLVSPGRGVIYSAVGCM